MASVTLNLRISDLRCVNRAKRLRIRLEAETWLKSDSVRLQWHFLLCLRLIKHYSLLNHPTLLLKKDSVVFVSSSSVNLAENWFLAVAWWPHYWLGLCLTHYQRFLLWDFSRWLIFEQRSQCFLFFLSLSRRNLYIFRVSVRYLFDPVPSITLIPIFKSRYHTDTYFPTYPQSTYPTKSSF